MNPKAELGKNGAKSLPQKLEFGGTSYTSPTIRE